MPDDIFNARADHFVGGGDGLLRVARIIGEMEHEFFAMNAAIGVDVVNGLLGAAFHLLAEHGIAGRSRDR